MSNFLVFIFFLAGNLAIGNYFGDLFQSPDSNAYREFISAPWTGEYHWNPTGTSYTLYVGKMLGLNVPQTFHLLGALVSFVLFLVLSQELGKKAAFLISLICLLDPSFIMLRNSLWSELPFILWILVIGYLISQRKINWWVKLLLCCLCMLFAIKTRRAAAFLLPAVGVGLGFVWSYGKWSFNLKKCLIGGLCTLGVVLVSDTSFGISKIRACIHLLVAWNSVPYCTWNENISACKKDPERRYINNFQIQNYFELVDFQSRALNFFEESEACKLKNEVFWTNITHAPLQIFNQIQNRFWKHFSRWEKTEKGDLQYASLDKKYQLRANYLDAVLNFWNHYQWIYRGFFLLSLIGIGVLRKQCTPAIGFFFIGSVCHALGVVITNPFRVLRYMALSKIFLTLAFIFIFYRLLKIYRAQKTE